MIAMARNAKFSFAKPMSTENISITIETATSSDVVTRLRTLVNSLADSVNNDKKSLMKNTSFLRNTA